jgi:hypothetical protein
MCFVPVPLVIVNPVMTVVESVFVPTNMTDPLSVFVGALPSRIVFEM